MVSTGPQGDTERAPSTAAPHKSLFTALAVGAPPALNTARGPYTVSWPGNYHNSPGSTGSAPNYGQLIASLLQGWGETDRTCKDEECCCALCAADPECIAFQILFADNYDSCRNDYQCMLDTNYLGDGVDPNPFWHCVRVSSQLFSPPADIFVGPVCHPGQPHGHRHRSGLTRRAAGRAEDPPLYHRCSTRRCSPPTSPLSRRRRRRTRRRRRRQRGWRLPAATRTGFTEAAGKSVFTAPGVGAYPPALETARGPYSVSFGELPQ